jgi:hypothetical protein
MMHGIALANATETCKYCEGNGTRKVYKSTQRPCNCVYRAIFRACLNRFRDCADTGTAFGTVSWEFCPGNRGKRIYSRKQEEYMADFCLVTGATSFTPSTGLKGRWGRPSQSFSRTRCIRWMSTSVVRCRKDRPWPRPGP